MKNSQITALGIMNGTSVDAVDYTLLRLHRKTLKPTFIAHQQRALPAPLRLQILKAASNQLTTFDLSQLHFDLGKLYAKHIGGLSKKWSWEVVGLHGQTVHHAGRRATLQLGTPAFLQAAQEAPVVSDFRAMDVAQGGEGAPFAPFFQKKLCPPSAKPFAFHNLGGISNLTWFQNQKVIAFDTGPANILMDLQIQKTSNGKLRFDKKGRKASKGLPAPKDLEKFLSHPYFRKKSPKSCGREEFNSTFLKSWSTSGFLKLTPEDQLATLAELTARSIANAYKGKSIPNVPEKIYFYGGGVYNDFLMSRIRYHLAGCQILTTEDLGWPSQALEAGIFGFLAASRLLKKTVHLPQVTGAKHESLLGQIYL